MALEVPWKARREVRSAGAVQRGFNRGVPGTVDGVAMLGKELAGLVA